MHARGPSLKIILLQELMLSPDRLEARLLSQPIMGALASLSGSLTVTNVELRWLMRPNALYSRAKKLRRTGASMRGAFNLLMRIVSSLIGFAMVAVGIVWILQGLDLAFRVGFMVGQRRWVLYGAILALVGIAQVVWSNTRQAEPA